MIGNYPINPGRKALKRILSKYREKILREVHTVKNFMALLMKGAQERWTEGELGEIKAHLVSLSKKIPVLMVFLLPGGILLLPILVEVLDRRKKEQSVPQERRKT